jgi:hypothetical protein
MKKIRRHEETNRKTERTERTPAKRIQLGKKPGDGKREDVNSLSWTKEMKRRAEEKKEERRLTMVKPREENIYT